MNDAGVRPFSIRALLEDRARYPVPMYQRNYAWGEGDITSCCRMCWIISKNWSVVRGRKPTISAPWWCLPGTMAVSR